MEETCGRIDEAGVIYSLTKQGFNFYKCLMELIANPIDANATNIKFNINRDYIDMLDDGDGMTKKSLMEMFAMYKSNHATERSLGISGIGGKVASFILSQHRKVIILTHSKGESYLKAVIPWNIMLKQEKYSNMITINSMSRSEINYFKSKLSNTGTIIRFPYSDKLCDKIKDNFIKLEESNMKENMNDFSPIVFGRFDNVNLEYTHYEKPDIVKKMKKYNYLFGNNNDFYCGKSIDKINQYYNWKTKDTRFIWEKENGEQNEIRKKGRGYYLKSTILNVGMNGYNIVGEFKVFTGQRLDTSVYDYDNPLTETVLDTRFQYVKNDLYCNYDKEHLSQELTEQLFNHLVKIPLVRNGQHIGVFACPDIKPSSMRGSAELYHTHLGVRADVHYNPVSNQDNKQDEIMGIQQNKNQWNPEDVPINFSRLVKDIKKCKAKKIWKSWLNRSREFHKRELVLEQQPELFVEQKPELVVEQKPELVVEQKPELVVEQKPELVVEQQPELFVEQKPELVVEQKPELFVEQKPELVVEQQPELVVEQQPELVVEQQPELVVEPVNVRSYRRGIVSRTEILNELRRVMNIINDQDENKHYNEGYLTLYNQLTIIN